MRDRAVLFGDGAGALVLEANESATGGGSCLRDVHDGAHWDKLLRPGVGCRFRPYVNQGMVDRLESVPIVEGRQVFRLAAQLMPAAVLGFSGRTGRRSTISTFS